MLQISEKDRDVVVKFMLKAVSTTHTVQQAVNLVNFLGNLKPVKKPDKKERAIKK